MDSSAFVAAESSCFAAASAASKSVFASRFSQRFTRAIVDSTRDEAASSPSRSFLRASSLSRAFALSPEAASERAEPSCAVSARKLFGFFSTKSSYALAASPNLPRASRHWAAPTVGTSSNPSGADFSSAL